MGMTTQFDTEWQAHDLDHVIKWFAKDFVPKPGWEVMDMEHYIDTDQRKVVFRIGLKRKSQETKP